MNRSRLFLPFAALCTWACGSGNEDTPKTAVPPFVCDAGALTVDDRGVTFGNACDGMALRLLPRVRIAGQWSGGNCEFGSDQARCPTDHGHVVATVSGNDVQLHFEATQDVVVEGFALMGSGALDGARGFLSNGFQSWSQSGALALGEPPTQEQLQRALADREDREVMRSGTELSWWYTFAGGNQRYLFAGALTADVFRSYAQVHKGGEQGLLVNLVSGGAGEEVSVNAGETLEGERWQLGLSSHLDPMLMRYASALPSRRATHPVAADAGWNSWYDLWDKVTEKDVRENAPLARSALEDRVPPSALPLRIVIDDGWQRAWGDWEPNEKFPSGMDGLATDLKAQGFRVGIWLAPLLVEEDSPLVVDHPEWFLTDASYPHPIHGRMRILDPTEPGAAQHLQQFIRRIVEWGYDFLKIDFLFAGTYEEPRHMPVTGMQAYHEALRLIREAAGEDVVLLAVGAPSHPSLPHVDAWRLGGDIAFEPSDVSWFFLPNQARSISARWHLCSAVLCDADPPLLRKLPRNEVEVGIWVAALAGGALFLSDDLRNLDQERVGWLTNEALRVALQQRAVAPGNPFPEDLPTFLTNPVADIVSRRNDHVIPAAWDLTYGQILFNFEEEDRTILGSKVPARSVRLVMPAE